MSSEIFFFFMQHIVICKWALNEYANCANDDIIWQVLATWDQDSSVQLTSDHRHLTFMFKALKKFDHRRGGREQITTKPLTYLMSFWDVSIFTFLQTKSINRSGFVSEMMLTECHVIIMDFFFIKIHKLTKG